MEKISCSSFRQSTPATTSGSYLSRATRSPTNSWPHRPRRCKAIFSPDGHFVAYTSNESGKFEVYVETFPRSERRWPVSTNGGYEPRWRADGREIYYLSEDKKLMAVSVADSPSFGVPVALFQTRVPAGISANRTHYVPSRDGKRFLVNTQSGDPSPTPITVVLNWTAALKK
jgi:Tol biopolymer transport system component